ncbi:unnamed protein product [Colias eurytheme]|nr:unnamed protein product [Colias eurytheme]
MEEVMNMLRKIQSELDEQKTTILKSGERVTDQVTQNINGLLEEKFAILEGKYENLKEKLENQEKRLYFLEKQARQRNIVFFGLEETETSYLNLESNLIKFLNKYFSLEVDNRDIQEARRIGKKGDKPRPITVTFSTLSMKVCILKQKKALKESGYYIQEDYPLNILEKRKELQEQVRIENEKGNLAIIKYDKLVILEKKKESTNNNKRMLSTSPENKQISNNEKKPQASKKNKTHTSLRRTSSLSEGVLKPGILNFLSTKDNKNKNI